MSQPRLPSQFKALPVGVLWIAALLFYWGSIFTIGVFSQKWGPETSCMNRLKPDGSTERFCKTEEVKFWETSADEFIKYGDGAGDVTHYLMIGNYFNDGPDLPNGEMSYHLKWALGNWAPGVPFIVSLVFKFWGHDHYFVKMLVLISLLLGAVASVYFWFFRESGWPWPLALAAPLSVFLLPDFRFQTLTFGYVVSEGWAVGAYLLAVLLVYRAYLQEKISLAVLAGLGLAASSYTRALVDTINGLSLKMLFAFAVGLLALYWLRHKKFTPQNHAWFKFFKVTAIIFVVHLLVLAPWKLRNLKQLGEYTMCYTSDSVFDLHWTLDDKMPGWISTTNVPCRLTPDLCTELHKMPEESWKEFRKYMTVAYLANHPASWPIYRLGDFNKFWTNYSYRPKGFRDWPWYMAWGEGLLYLGFGFLWLFQLWRRRNQLIRGFDGFVAACILANAGIFLVAPYEHRYSLFLRIALLQAGLYELGQSSKSAVKI